MAGAASASSCLSMWRRRVTKPVLIVFGAAAMFAGLVFDIAPAHAQIMTFPQAPQRIKKTPVPRPPGEKAPMLPGAA